MSDTDEPTPPQARTRSKEAADPSDVPPGLDEQTTEEDEDKDHRFTMTIDLSVLESLGINLYSNAAAVLSELVANAYDADATLVTIDWKSKGEKIVVSDDGRGMSTAEINARFLKAGYKKRANEGFVSPRWGRSFMGRKGIGKLSIFSIAHLIDVFTSKDGEHNGLRINVKELEARIEDSRPYHPEPIEVGEEHSGKGTTLVLTQLRRKRATITANALRKRLARRFDVLSTVPREDGGFYIDVNTKRITFADRQELKKLEFVWEFGNDDLPTAALPPDVQRFVVDNPPVVPGHEDWRVRGWFGTAKVPSDLTDDEEAGSLKNIIVLARGRPIQEGIVERLDFSRLFGNYVTGQIEADFLDLDDGYDDIATSDRQRLIEDDERVVALRDFLRTAFVRAADEWSELRPKKAAKDVLSRYPKLRAWVDGREEEHRDFAEKTIGTIASLEIEGDDGPKAKADLFRAGVLAFERVGLRKASQDLERLSEVTAETLLPLLGRQDAYEAGLWVDILRSRVEAIERFRGLEDDTEKEKVLDAHLFDHLWLLDASWERATLDPKIEQQLRDAGQTSFAEDLAADGGSGSIRVRYATAGGQHLVVDLKRYSARPTIDELHGQGLGYVKALRSVLPQPDGVAPGINVVFVLGAAPQVPDSGLSTKAEYMESRFASIRGRFRTYDELIDGAKLQYERYLDASEKARALDDLLGTWGTELEAPEARTVDPPPEGTADRAATV